MSASPFSSPEENGYVSALIAHAAQVTAPGRLERGTTANGWAATDSDEERLDKAADAAKFEITCAKDGWEQTRESRRDPGSTPFHSVKPVKLGGEQGGRGLVTVTLTGPQLVESLRMPDYDAHGGTNANNDDGPVARRVYNALAPVIDRIKPGRPPEGIPRAVVDDAAVPAGPAPSPSPAPSKS
ncbi:hypothetical protein [Streptomyces sp. TE33382]